MFGSLNKFIRPDRERVPVPRSVQDIIPVRAIWHDGIFLTGRNTYSKMFRFRDINYTVASDEDRDSMIRQYIQLLNSLDTGSVTQILLNNSRLNRLDFERNTLIPMRNDEHDPYRKEVNYMMNGHAASANSIIQDRYVTISVTRKSIEDARLYFARIGTDLSGHFNRIGSQVSDVDTKARMEIIHNFFRAGEETFYDFDLKNHMKRGHDFRDYICPDSFENHADYFRMGDRYGRVLLFRDYASFIKDDIVSQMTDLSRNMMLSINIVPVPMDVAIRDIEQRMLGVETNIAQYQRKQNMNNNFSAVIPYDMEQQRKETKEFLDDLVARDQKMMLVTITLVHTADTKKQLDSDTEQLMTIVRQSRNQMSVLRYQQLDGLQTTMPFGVKSIEATRTLTSEALAAFIPFRVQEVHDRHGIFYGVNVISKNMIIADRRRLLNGNSFILGIPGGGKSFFAKEEILFLFLNSDADIIIIDPEREYRALIQKLGGSVIEISATSRNHINAMDMSRNYGETDPIIEKSQFLQSLCEQIVAGHKFQKGQQSIIDRCTENVYRYYQQGNYMGTPPTLQDFRDELLRQPEPEAHSLALELELFTRGSLNTFAKQTNVDTSNRLICYDILELGEQLRAVGMLVILDSILNRITQNRQKGKETYIFIDELYLLFLHEYSAQFLYKLWKRVRKYGAFCTGITQNVSDLLQSYTARTMLSNSEFIVMLNQAASDRFELAKLLNISNEQLSYITNVDAGHGLIKIGPNLVPFENHFPKDTELYSLLTTKLAEVQENRDAGSTASPIPDDEQAEFIRRIQEVASKYEGFSAIVNKYLDQDGDA